MIDDGVLLLLHLQIFRTQILQKKIRTRMCAPNWVWNLLAWPTDGGRFIILPIHLFIPFFNYYLTYSIHLLSPFFNFYFSNWIIHTVFQLLFNLLIYSHRFSIIIFLIELFVPLFIYYVSYSFTVVHLLCFLFIYCTYSYRFQLCFFIHFILLFVSYYY